MKIIVDGDLISFDISKVKIKELILQHFREETIQDIVEKNENEFIFKHLYKLQKTKEFSGYFSSLLKVLSIKLDGVDFHYQKIPTFRIQRVGCKTVNYHNDVMYGHGEKVVNVWVPLIDTNRYNSLHLSDIKTSKFLFERIRKDKLSIIEINKLLKEYCSPKIVQYGQMMLFNTVTMHGTEINSSTEHRLSFDFRILPYGEKPGKKDVSVFYNEINQTKRKKTVKQNCLFYLSQKSQIVKNFNHSLQREILNSFADKNYLQSNGFEETEIMGVDHYPNLFHFVIHENIENIVMLSILCLPDDEKERLEVLNEALKNKVKLYFFMENTNNKDSSVEKLNRYFQSVIHAESLL